MKFYPADDKTDEFFRTIKAEAPQHVTVMSDGSGKWFFYFCPRCGRRGQAVRKDKKLIQARASEHERECK